MYQTFQKAFMINGKSPYVETLNCFFFHQKDSKCFVTEILHNKSKKKCKGFCLFFFNKKLHSTLVDTPYTVCEVLLSCQHDSKLMLHLLFSNCYVENRHINQCYTVGPQIG